MVWFPVATEVQVELKCLHALPIHYPSWELTCGKLLSLKNFSQRFLPTPHMALQEEIVLGHFSCCRYHITIFSFNMIWSHCKRLTLRNKNGNYINPKKTYKYFINRSTKITCLEKLYSWFAFTKVHFMVTNNI